MAPVVPLITTASQGSIPDAPQAGTKPDLHNGDNRFSGNVVLQDGSLWGVQSVLVAGRTSVRWYEIDATTNVIKQTGEITDPSLYLYYPSIAVNNFGDVVIGMSGSDNSTFASSYAVVGATNAGTTTFGPLTLLHAGSDDYVNTDNQDRNRWGDYSATVIDPNNERIFWTFQEFVAPDRVPPPFALIDDNWAVRITELIIPEPGSFALFVVGGLLVLGRRRSRRE